MARDHALREAVIALREIEQEACKRDASKKKSILKEMEELKEREIFKESFRSAKERQRAFKEKVYNEMVSTALKGIYVTALQEHMFMNEETYKVSEFMVDKFIRENGGAFGVLDMMKESYLLETMKKYIIEKSEDVIKDADKDDADMENVPDESKEELLDRMEKEDDVEDAVHIISDRIAAAEEEFIKKNKKDKEKIESIVNDINGRINAVDSDLKMDDETKEEIKKECAIKQKKQIRAVYENREHTVFEQMVHNMSRNILSDPETKSVYMSESGGLDVEHVIDSTKCLYGFMEFVNTVGLVKVDENYIKENLENM